MQIIILSGGSGKRLWPFSNEARSKQFLKLIPRVETGQMESMIQRVVRQIKESGIEAPITIATNELQRDSIVSQLGNDVSIVTEPARHNTFPAICLASEFLSKIKKCNDDEVVVVLPCDQLTESSYFNTIRAMVDLIKQDKAKIIMMGIRSKSVATDFGYILPDKTALLDNNVYRVRSFKEKPDKKSAEKYAAEGAFWNAGVYAFRLGFIRKIAEKFVKGNNFEEIKANFDKYPHISFDYEVAEKCNDIAVVAYEGSWKDLGSWASILNELKLEKIGKVSMANNENSHVLNELQLPILCVGTQNLVVAASPDGILIADKEVTDFLNEHTDNFNERPMFEERRWGIYQVIDHVAFDDKYETLTKRLTLNPGKSISYQRHKYRDETWTFIDGEGIIILNGESKKVKRGDTIQIDKGIKHALLAKTPLTFIEVQAGSNLVEEDIERFDWNWEID